MRIRSHKNYLLVLGGPTAVGKTSLAIDIALHFDTEILSADSRQIYKELTIGTAKPTRSELNQVNHHFIGEKSIHEKFSAADYEREALQRLTSLFAQRHVVICTGGTGLYLRAITDGLDDIPDVPREIELEIQAQFEQHGIDYLVEELSVRDPIHAQSIDEKNPHRVIRALAVSRSTGLPYSSFLTGKKKKRPFDIIKVCLTRERDELYNRINQRVDQMMANGLEAEVKALTSFKEHRALQTVGYKELFSFFEDHYDRLRAVELIKQNSRRYAKRQMTWFRNQGKWHFVAADSKNVFEKILNLRS